MSKLASAVSNRKEDYAGRPYAPSWVDRILQWIDRLPLSAWLFYLILLFVALLIEHVIQWVEGSLPAGIISPTLVAEATFLIFAPAAQQYLNATARQALREFWPALQIDDIQYAELQAEYQIIDKISTWPWRTETLRTFLTTITLPIIMYLISRFIGRLVGL